PYLPRSGLMAGQVLRQNTGQPAAILRRVQQARRQYGDSLARAQRDAGGWKPLVQAVDRVVRVMPLWKLQTVGRSQLDFLYENRGTGTAIELRPGVVYCLRQFYELIGDLVRGAWLRYVCRYNQDVFGTPADLPEFL